MSGLGDKLFRCTCPGAGHDPRTCALTEDSCRNYKYGRICGAPKGHEGECFQDDHLECSDPEHLLRKAVAT